MTSIFNSFVRISSAIVAGVISVKRSSCVRLQIGTYD